MASILGGLLIGTAAGLLLLLRGRVAGVGGAFGGLIVGGDDIVHKALFVAGLATAGLVARLVHPNSFKKMGLSYGVVLVAGVVVGFGMQRGAGCTSGHGVCGMARLSKRSVVATLTFMATAALTVFATHHLGGVR
jgi:uncharacterized membrane protein YedE/YeeE